MERKKKQTTDMTKQAEDQTKNRNKNFTKLTIEEQLQQIGRIASELENGSSGLEEALEKYEEGVRLVRGCASQIDRVQKRIKVIETETEDES